LGFWLEPQTLQSSFGLDKLLGRTLWLEVAPQI
jgi:hypothetical protein